MVRPRHQPPDPYAVLGVMPGTSRADIRRAYRQRAMAIHPDITGQEGTEAMASLNHARDQLLGQPAIRSSPAWGGARGEEGANPEDGPTGQEPHRARERPGWAPAHDFGLDGSLGRLERAPPARVTARATPPGQPWDGPGRS